MSGNLKKLGIVGISCECDLKTLVHMNPRSEVSWDFMKIHRKSWDLMESYELLGITGKSCDSLIPKALKC
jgi:hypothetical protein